MNVIEQPRSRKKLESQGSEGERRQLYTVATKKAIRSLMQEYKKRKQHHSRSIFVKKPTFKEQKYTRNKSGEVSLTPAERQRRKQIQNEQQSSIVQDGEAQMGTWGNMLGTMLRLIQLLPQDQFTAFLPAIFPCVNQLVCHVTDDHVRTGVMEFMDRVAYIHASSDPISYARLGLALITFLNIFPNCIPHWILHVTVRSSDYVLS